MVKANFRFTKLKREYIFPWIEEKLREVRASNPEAHVINMGIGDIALPLAGSVAEAVREATDEMTRSATLRGYGPSEGYPFLRKAVHRDLYKELPISSDDIFISDGINTDIVNILDLFDDVCSVGIVNPAYPAYLDSNVLGGRKKIRFLPCREESGFIPRPPEERLDLLYLCSPHNPTGVAMTQEQIAPFVDYALREKSILLFDHAYAAYGRSENVPKTIYELQGAEKTALEFCSFSKTAGFTGLRCSHTVIPAGVSVRLGKKEVPLQALWRKRQSIKFNGVAYPVQKGAEAALSARGKKETLEQVDSYLRQAGRIKAALDNAGHTSFGGVDAPYLWWKAPLGMSSKAFFAAVLANGNILSIPGSGFGEYGEGYVRLSSFLTEENTSVAVERIKKGIV